MLEFLKKRRNVRIAILSLTAGGLLALSYYLSAIVNPLLISLLIAYILNPLVNRIENTRIRIFGREVGTGRTGAVIIIYLGGLSLVVLSFILVVPVVFREIRQLSSDIPGEPTLTVEEVFQSDKKRKATVGITTRPLAEPFIDRNGDDRRDPKEEFSDVNGNGVWDLGEPYKDTNNNGSWDDGEAFVDTNTNGTFDAGDPFEDRNKNGRWDEGDKLLDTNGDGLWNPPDPYTDSNKNKKYDRPEPFTDKNGNGKHDEGEPFADDNSDGSWTDGEPFTDQNGDGRWDEGESFLDLDGNGAFDPAESFEDKDNNGTFTESEPFIDRNQNGIRDLAEEYQDWNENGKWDRDIQYPAHISLTTEPFVDENSNGQWDPKESFTHLNSNWGYDAYLFYLDANGNGVLDPGLADQTLFTIRDLTDWWNKKFPDQRISFTFGSMRGELEKYFQGGEEYQSFSSWILYAVKSGLMGILDLVSIFVLIPFYTFFFLKSLNGIRETIHDNLPGRYRDRIWHILEDIHRSVSSFFRGRLVISLLVGALTWLVLALLDVNFSLLLGILMGVTIVVPLLSVIVVSIPVIIICVVSGGSLAQAIGALLGLGVIQNVETFYITPKVLGKETQLHPISIFVSFLVGGSLLGLFGILLAVPLASITKILGREFILPQIRALAKEKPPVDNPEETGLFERVEVDEGEPDRGPGGTPSAPSS